MTNTTAPARPGVKMTIRVYQVDRYGTVTQDRGTLTTIRYGENQLPKVGGFPPCTCPRCRAGQAATE